MSPGLLSVYYDKSRGFFALSRVLRTLTLAFSLTPCSRWYPWPGSKDTDVRAPSAHPTSRMTKIRESSSLTKAIQLAAI